MKKKENKKVATKKNVTQTKGKLWALIYMETQPSVRMSSARLVSRMVMFKTIKSSASKLERFEEAKRESNKLMRYVAPVLINKNILDEYGDIGVNKKDPLYIHPDVHMSHYHQIIKMNKDVFQQAHIINYDPNDIGWKL
jgi:hypothetical protein